MAKILVVFGAGASYDAVPKSKKSSFSEADRMPLANSLFADYGVQNNHLKEYNVVRIADILRGTIERGGSLDIEEELDKLEEKSNSIFALKKELFELRFYLRYVIQAYTNDLNERLSRRTNYVTLLNQLQELKKQKGVLVSLATFNYDLLLDSAIELVSEQWDRNMESFSNYMSGLHRDFNYYKIHGSTDWAWKLPENWEWGTGIRAIIDKWNYVDLEECKLIRCKPSESDSLIPAISIPFKTKTEFSMPEGILKKLIYDLDGMTGLLAIGWKGGDTHFVDLLQKYAKNLHKIVIVTPHKDSFSVIKDNLHILQNVNFKLIDKEFCDFVSPTYIQNAINYLLTASRVSQ